MLHILRFLLRHDFHVEVIKAQDVFIILRDLFVFDAVVVVIHLLLFHFSDLVGGFCGGVGTETPPGGWLPEMTFEKGVSSALDFTMLLPSDSHMTASKFAEVHDTLGGQELQLQLLVSQWHPERLIRVCELTLSRVLITGIAVLYF